MTARLTSAFKVGALIRRTHDAGGSAMVLAKGDPMSGAILVVAVERGRNPTFYERGVGAAGTPALIRTGPTSSESDAADDYWQRRRRNDPDLWIIELDVADSERFAAETITAD